MSPNLSSYIKQYIWTITLASISKTVTAIKKDTHTHDGSDDLRIAFDLSAPL